MMPNKYLEGTPEAGCPSGWSLADRIMSDGLSVIYRVAGALIAYQGITMATNTRVWAIHSHAGIIGLLISLATIGSVLLAILGGIMLVLNRTKAPIFLIASVGCVFVGGAIFPFVPESGLLMRMNMGPLWVIGLNILLTGLLLWVMVKKLNSQKDIISPE